MAVREILFLALIGCLIVTVVPAVLFHAQPRLAGFFPLKGRWLPPFLWTFSVILFVVMLLVSSSGP
ncbi:MAG: hypothetical protein ACO1SX_01395 [Actinomycetota bacterium]